MKKTLAMFIVLSLLNFTLLPLAQAEEPSKDLNQKTTEPTTEISKDEAIISEDVEPKLSEDPVPEENKEIIDKLEPEETTMSTKSLSNSFDPFLDYAADPMGTQKSLGIYETDLSTGAATYNYPLTLPPGRDNVQSEIVLAYNNQAAADDSIAGYGWDLFLGGTITRTQEYGFEEIYSTNEFYLNMPGASGKLIPVSLIDSEHGEYGLQVEESFYRYEFLQNNSWVVTNKDGTKYYFGQTTDSRQDDPNDSAGIFEWELDLVQDTSGNYVRFEYFKDQGQIYPKAIYYTGYGEPSVMNDGPVEVRFQPFYDGVQTGDERGDWTKWYDKGFEVRTDYLLTGIEIVIDGYLSGQPVREYEFTYTTGDNGNRSMLEFVVERGTSVEGDVVELPATEFTYSKNDGAYNFTYQGVYAGLSEHSHFIDVNGDGYADQTPFDESQPAYPYLYTKLGSRGGSYGGQHFVSDYSHSGAPNSPVDAGHFVDMNGDALPEYMVLFNQPGNACLYTNYGEGFMGGNRAECGDSFLDREQYGYRFGDFDGDGLLDLFTGDITASDWTSAGGNIYLNDGDFNFVDSGIDSPLAFAWGADDSPGFHEGQDTGARLVDINGDGLIDIAHGYQDLNYDFYSTDNDPAVLYYYLNDGAGNFILDTDYDLEVTADFHFTNMEYDSYWLPDETYYSSSNKICYADFNGDGIVDVLRNGTAYVWDGVDTWTGANVQAVDFQASCGGVYYGGNTWSYGSGDLNGDGLMDFFESLELINNGVRGTQFNVEGKPDLLTGVSTSLGADISISYKSALQYEDSVTGALLNPDLPFVLYTVEEVLIDDGLGGQSVTTYEYRGGHYFKYFDGLTGEFSKFEEVAVFEDGATTVYYFDTGCREGELCAADGLEDEMIILVDGYGSYVVDGDYLRNVTVNLIDIGLCPNINCFTAYESYEADVLNMLQEGEVWDDSGDDFMYEIDDSKYALKGKLRMVEFYDDLGVLYSRTVNEWGVTDLGGGRYYPHLDQVTDFAFDGELDARETAVSYTYNDAYGLLMNEVQWGEVSEVPGDELYINYSYAFDENLWVFKQAEIILEDGDGTVLSDVKYFYDENTILGDVGVGLLTEESVWVDEGDYWLSTGYGYDDYGNVTSTVNPRGYETTVIYDSWNFYPEIITNALQQSVSIEVNYINGEPAEYTDYNGYTYYYTYDGLARPWLVEGPSVDGLSTVLHASYEYDDLNVPRLVREIVSDGTMDGFNTYTYLDALNREVQVRIEGENQYSVVDTLYNSRGEVDLNTLAYFSAGVAYTSADLTQPMMEYAYDSLLRVASATTPLGVTTTDYLHWDQTVTDAEGNSNIYYHDAYGNLVQVDEIGLYSTYYDYDLLGNLIQIEDVLGNVRGFDYDSLGRLTMQEEMHAVGDQDYAQCLYYYDENGNLDTAVTPDNRIAYAYDELDRLTSVMNDMQPHLMVHYTYDTATNGVGFIADIDDAAGSVSYDYDALGAVISEMRIVGGDRSFTSFVNDLMGRVESITYPSSFVASYAFNEGGFTESVTYDGEIVISDINYSPMGQWEEVYYGNGDVTINTYDPQQMYFLDNKITTALDGTVLQDLWYDYDAVGNVDSIIDQSDLDTAKELYYVYDDLYRLTSATAQSSTGLIYYDRSYDYNAIGNMTYKSDIGDLFYDQTGNANLYAVTAAGAYAFDYDLNGNVISDGGFTYDYDYRNRMLWSDDGQGGRVDYSYDFSGNRMMKDDGAGNVSYYPNQYYEIEYFDDGSEVFREYVFVDGVRVMVNEFGVLGFTMPVLMESQSDYKDWEIFNLDLTGWIKEFASEFVAGK